MLGPYRLHFTHMVLPPGIKTSNIGTLNIGAEYVGQVTLRCRSVTGSRIWMALGHVEDEGDTRDFNGWIVEAVQDECLFFERSHKRKGSLTYEVRQESYLSESEVSS